MHSMQERCINVGKSRSRIGKVNAYYLDACKRQVWTMHSMQERCMNVGKSRSRVGKVESAHYSRACKKYSTTLSTGDL